MFCCSIQGSHLTHLKLFLDHSGSDSRKSNSCYTVPLPGSTAGKESGQHKDPPLALKDRPQTMHLEQAVTGKTPFPIWSGNILLGQILVIKLFKVLRTQFSLNFMHIFTFPNLIQMSHESICVQLIRFSEVQALATENIGFFFSKVIFRLRTVLKRP